MNNARNDGTGSAAQSEPAEAAPRQWVEKVPGTSRRSRLTHVAGTDPSPEAPLGGEDTVFGSASGAAASGATSAAGPNDERLRRDKPPHWS